MPPLLTLILDQLQVQKIINPFVLLYGPGADTQWSAVRESCQQSAGFFAYQDILEVKDYTTLLGKPHSLKVELKKNDDADVLNKQEGYVDVGSREINQRLSMAPAGDTKIVLIEHIDRATIGAANALLKSLEEPLPHRLIIASVSNKDTILPTILSRALLIHCDAAYVPESLSPDQKEVFDSVVGALSTQHIAVLNKSSTTIAKESWSKLFLHNLLSTYAGQGRYDIVPHIIQTLRQIESNVSVEHSLFSLFLKLLG